MTKKSRGPRNATTITEGRRRDQLTRRHQRDPLRCELAEPATELPVVTVMQQGSSVNASDLELYGHVTPRMRANAAARFGSLLLSARIAPLTAMTAES